MFKPKVSVVLPVFNGGQYIKESIDSVLSQVYQNFEFLICDDASNDNTVDIIASMKDSRIKFFKNKFNKGPFATLNFLIGKSQAKLIKLWSADDLMKENCLEAEVKFNDKNSQIGFSYSEYDRIDNNGNLLGRAPYDDTPEIIPPLLASQIMFYYGSIAGTISNVMMRKDVLGKVGFFREDMRFSADFELWVRVCKIYSLGLLKETLIYVREHPGQDSHNPKAILGRQEEEKVIYKELEKRLPASIHDWAVRYSFKKTNILKIRYLISTVLKGRLRAAWEMLIVNSRQQNIFYAFFLWFITLNGRFLERKPKFFY